MTARSALGATRSELQASRSEPQASEGHGVGPSEAHWTPRICILGAGGLGSLVGGWLADSGVPVTLVGRPAHVAAIRARGLAIRGIRGDHTVRQPLEAVSAPADARGEFDYLILAVKAKDTEAALAEAAPLLARARAALSLQNTLC